ncbi:MAG: hypothetical protein ABIN89_18950 [Chitinophagaceae bacterium]
MPPFETSFKINKNDLSITIGNNNCAQPYKTSIYNIRVKDSFKRRVVQKIIRESPSNDNVAVSVEDMITYQLVGGEKILQIGPEYFGCRTERGGFDARKFKQNAGRESVKMVELNLSSANKQSCDIVSTNGFEYP